MDAEHCIYCDSPCDGDETDDGEAVCAECAHALYQHLMTPTEERRILTWWDRMVAGIRAALWN
jgi:transcription initiation factor TFIIIB Brf1 subunit/transcription initiation factor TFIIB